MGSNASETGSLIADSCLHFLEELFTANAESRQIAMKIPQLSASNDRRDLVLKTRTSFSFAFQLRALSQIYKLLLHNQHATKRDLYYEYKKLYGRQQNLDQSITILCKFLQCNRKSLHVTSCSRGYAIGNLKLLGPDGHVAVDFGSTPILLHEKLMELEVESNANLLLVVEKDSVFQRLIDEKFLDQFPKAILVTGRGYPDLCTRDFLQWLSGRINIRFFALMDADPYGLEIFATYKYGSVKNCVESRNAIVQKMEWIGFFPTEVGDLPIARNHFLPLRPSDHRKIAKLIHRFRCVDAKLVSELEHLSSLGFKLELEAISSIRPNFLSSMYLRKKFEFVCASV